LNLVLLFPGQGSQKPGMGKDLAASFAEARAVFEQVDDALGEPFSRLCFEGPAETLTLTQNAQPALLAHGAAVVAITRGRMSARVLAAAGHSLGELTAYHAAGTLTLSDAVKLVRRRGELMFAAGVERPGTMAAVLGDMNRSIDAVCRDATDSAEGGLVVPANYNSPGQVVISGEVAGVEKAMELARDAGARRAIRLAVSGAFHSPLMAPAREGLAEALETTLLASPSMPVFANVNANPVCDADTARRLLIEQVTSPVQWSQIVERLASAHPDALFVEMGPGVVLTGLVKKIAPHVRVMSCGTRCWRSLHEHRPGGALSRRHRKHQGHRSRHRADAHRLRGAGSDRRARSGNGERGRQCPRRRRTGLRVRRGRCRTSHQARRRRRKGVWRDRYPRQQCRTDARQYHAAPEGR
jgi:[acyl-carrier-protein] S-malonyltransferase